MCNFRQLLFFLETTGIMSCKQRNHNEYWTEIHRGHIIKPAKEKN